MYGPPRDCKGKSVKTRDMAAQMYSAFGGVQVSWPCWVYPILGSRTFIEGWILRAGTGYKGYGNACATCPWRRKAECRENRTLNSKVDRNKIIGLLRRNGSSSSWKRWPLKRHRSTTLWLPRTHVGLLDSPRTPLGTLGLLRNIRAAMPNHGRLLLAERVLDESPALHPGKLLDIEMIAFVGGKERTAGEFRQLLLHSGFKSDPHALSPVAARGRADVNGASWLAPLGRLTSTACFTNLAAALVWVRCRQRSRHVSL